MKTLMLKTLLSAAALAAATTCSAGVYSDDLSRCLVTSTSSKDKTDLVRWVFANASLHPQLAGISSLSAEQRAAYNRTTASLFQRLLTETCKKQSQEAIKYEGPLAFQTSFQMLGQVAMQELVSDPAVNQGFGDFLKYMDDAKLRDLGMGKPQR